MPTQTRRHAPFLFHVVAEVEHAVERLPGFSVVFAAEKSNRTDAHVDDALVVRIDGKRAHVAFHDFRPGLAGVFGAIAAVEGHRGKNDFRLFRAADQMLEGFALEELADRAHGTATVLHHLQSAVVSDVVAQRLP